MLHCNNITYIYIYIYPKKGMQHKCHTEGVRFKSAQYHE